MADGKPGDSNFMRYLPFLIPGTTFLECAPLYGGEEATNFLGDILVATDRIWVRKLSPMEKEVDEFYVEVTDKATFGDTGTAVEDSALGMRYNTDKVKFGLIPGHWTRVLAQILTVGAKKYAPRNWEKGLVHSEILDSLFRHLDSYLRGERYDPETKCHHLGHVAWNALALMTMDLKGIGKADLPADDDVATMETTNGIEKRR